MSTSYFCELSPVTLFPSFYLHHDAEREADSKYKHFRIAGSGNVRSDAIAGAVR